MSKNDELNKKLAQIEKDKAKNIKTELKNKITELNGVPFLEAIVPLDGSSIKDILFQFKSEMDSLIAVIGGKSEGKCTLSILISENLVKEKSLNAGNMIRNAAQHIQGGGGGQPFFATAGGKNPKGITDALQQAKTYIS
jgi:alanyl-tRNA synthetase